MSVSGLVRALSNIFHTCNQATKSLGTRVCVTARHCNWMVEHQLGKGHRTQPNAGKLGQFTSNESLPLWQFFVE